MEKTVVIVGAGDPVGARLVKDFLKRGYRVFAGYLAGQQALEIEGVSNLTIDPFSQDSADEAAEAVKEQAGGADMLVLNYDCCMERDARTILERPDFAWMKSAYEYNTLGPLRAMEAFLPVLEAGEGKRVCVVTSADSSNNAARGIDDYPGHVSKAPLNMAMHQYFNDLRPKGYTFRMYCKDPRAGAEKVGEFAAEYFTRNRSNEPESYQHSDENRLVLRDWMGIEVPW